MLFRATTLLLISNLAFTQPAQPPAPHVEALTPHDLSSDSVGATAGDFRVDEGGAASYTLPILSLPGTVAGLDRFLAAGKCRLARQHPARTHRTHRTARGIVQRELGRQASGSRQ